MITAEDLAAIRAVLEFRTRGTWIRDPRGLGCVIVSKDDPEIDPAWREAYGFPESSEFYDGALVAESIGEPDLTLIANAPRWLAGLVELLDRAGGLAHLEDLLREDAARGIDASP